jgi:hypothetical protein
LIKGSVVERAGAGVVLGVEGVGAAVRANDLGRIDKPAVDQVGQRIGRTAELEAVEHRGVVEHHQVVEALQAALFRDLHLGTDVPRDEGLGGEQVTRRWIVRRRQERRDVAVVVCVEQVGHLARRGVDHHPHGAVRVGIDRVVFVLDDERAHLAIVGVADVDLVTAVVELALDQTKMALADVGQPGLGGPPEQLRPLDAKDYGHVGPFDNERIGSGDRQLADHRVGEEFRERIAAQAELVFELSL